MHGGAPGALQRAAGVVAAARASRNVRAKPPSRPPMCAVLLTNGSQMPSDQVDARSCQSMRRALVVEERQQPFLPLAHLERDDRAEDAEQSRPSRRRRELRADRRPGRPRGCRRARRPGRAARIARCRACARAPGPSIEQGPGVEPEVQHARRAGTRSSRTGATQSPSLTAQWRQPQPTVVSCWVVSRLWLGR